MGVGSKISPTIAYVSVTKLLLGQIVEERGEHSPPSSVATQLMLCLSIQIWQKCLGNRFARVSDLDNRE
jgi:hypothetical protein